MQKFLIALLLFVLPYYASAQGEADVQGAPITVCAEVKGNWHNPYDLKIDLTLASDCTFTLKARGMSAHGTATLHKSGTLVVPFKVFGGGDSDRFMLRKDGADLTGKVVYGISFRIRFHRII